MRLQEGVRCCMTALLASSHLRCPSLCCGVEPGPAVAQHQAALHASASMLVLVLVLVAQQGVWCCLPEVTYPISESEVQLGIPSNA
jgi:hypothetical protein